MFRKLNVLTVDKNSEISEIACTELSSLFPELKLNIIKEDETNFDAVEGRHGPLYGPLHGWK